ncbi:MAG TPA: prephenate dehydratase [Solirubrobacteraceae bacterium]|jgi:prephenate dehydratase|nr:prephenate dehydratase [Solirubrobacteraceae bacterium]
MTRHRPRPEAGAARPRVAYLGPEGTFSEEALFAGTARGSVEPLAEPGIFEAAGAVREGRADWAIVPIENSLEGSVNATLDLLADGEGALRVVGEQLLRVRHSLIAAAKVDLGEIELVLTHPQVPGQCLRFLRGELPGAQVLPAASTAEAVRTVVADGGRGRAAIGTLLAAQIYGGVVLRESVQDRDDNETRFVWLGRGDAGGSPPLQQHGEEGWKTSIVFWGEGAARPGWLVRCLNELADRDVNLTRIESRPRRERLGSYMFFADLEGSIEDEAVSSALAAMGGASEEVRVLGSYRAARPATLAP